MTSIAQKLIETVNETVHGKHDAVEMAVITLLAGGHLLVEDLPGVGKTLLARTLAQSLDLPFQRVQCRCHLQRHPDQKKVETLVRMWHSDQLDWLHLHHYRGT